jgi:DNA-directed RNA polymerase specialized sigma24 family protein
VDPVLATLAPDDGPGAASGAASTFAGFVSACEPGLRRALVAAFGPEAGRDAAADALAWAWQHWDDVRGMANPGGYLFRMGRNAARRRLRREARGRELEAARGGAGGAAEPAGEPGLTAALAALSERQRTAVLLVHGYGYTLVAAATAMGCSPSTVRNHLARALSRLRDALGVVTDG